MLVRSVASPRNGFRISDRHQNTVHYVRFTFNQSLNTSVLPHLAKFLRVQSCRDQLYRHCVLIIVTVYHLPHQLSALAEQPSRVHFPEGCKNLLKIQLVHKHFIYLPTGKKSEKPPNIYTCTFSYYIRSTYIYYIYHY